MTAAREIPGKRMTRCRGIMISPREPPNRGGPSQSPDWMKSFTTKEHACRHFITLHHAECLAAPSPPNVEQTAGNTAGKTGEEIGDVGRL